MAFRRSRRTRRAANSSATTRRQSFRRSAAHGRGSVRVRVWTPSEISELRRCYKNTTNAQIARSFGRTVASVRAKANQLSLKKSRTFLSDVAKTAGHGGWNASGRTSRYGRTAGSRRRTATRRASGRRSTSRRASSRRNWSRRTR